MNYFQIHSALNGYLECDIGETEVYNFLCHKGKNTASKGNWESHPILGSFLLSFDSRDTTELIRLNMVMDR